MKRERMISCLIGALLAFALSFGGVGCMVTGLRLDGGSMILLGISCAFFAALSAACFSLKWGGTLVLCLLALASGFLLHSRDALEQLYAMLYRISYLYDCAYGWGVLKLGGTNGGALTAAYPLGVLGCLVAVCVSWTVCRRKCAVGAVLAALLPLAACLVVTDTVPDEGYLYLLILGLLVLIFTNGLRRDSESQGNLLTLLAAGPLALALGILFLMVPHESYVNQTLGLQRQILAWTEGIPSFWETLEGESLGSGLDAVKPTEVNLRNIGPRVNYTYPVMDVTGAKNGALYLRDQDYDEYDGLGWAADPERREYFGSDVLPDILAAAGEVTISTKRGRELFFLPYYPGARMELTGGRVSNGSGMTDYSFIQWTLLDDWRTLAVPGERTAGTAVQTGGGDSRYLALPRETKGWAESLLDTILTGEETTVQKADAIAAYVRASAPYDQNTEKMPAGETDFARWFLENGETGYCVHYATAATVLLRAAGIRARYVTGYLLRAKDGVAVTVTADQAHAWAEYYEPSLGLWIVLEATPGALAGAEETEGSAPTDTTAGEPADDTSPGQTEQTQPMPDTQPDETAQMPTNGGEQEQPKDNTFRLPEWLKGLGAAVLWLAGAVLLVAGQRELRLYLRRQRRCAGSPNDQALARWREAVRLYRRLKQTPPRELEQLAQKARFSQHTLTAEELQTFDAHLRQARQACREKPWYAQLVDRYLFAAY